MGVSLMVLLQVLDCPKECVSFTRERDSGGKMKMQEKTLKFC